MRALLLCFLLVGCACKPEMRVEKPPAPPVILIPAHPYIAPTSSPSEVARAVRLYINELETTLNKAVSALDAYR